MAEHLQNAVKAGHCQLAEGVAGADQAPPARCLEAEKANHFQTVMMGDRYPTEVKDRSLMGEMEAAPVCLALVVEGSLAALLVVEAVLVVFEGSLAAPAVVEAVLIVVEAALVGSAPVGWAPVV